MDLQKIMPLHIKYLVLEEVQGGDGGRVQHLYIYVSHHVMTCLYYNIIYIYIYIAMEMHTVYIF